MFRNVVLRAILRLNRTVRRIHTPNVCYLTTSKGRLFRTVLYLNGFYNMVKPAEELERDLKKACETSEKAIVDLLMVIKKCISEISKEYRTCLERQINITKSATEVGPVGAHWDDLTKYRVQANDLKQELANYQALLRTLGQIAHDQSVVAFLTGAKDNMDLISEKYAKLDEAVQEELRENQKLEMRLLFANRDSILKTANNKKNNS